MDKKDFWPKEGKLKKGLIVLTIVIVSALLITLLEEKTIIKTKKLTFVIAFACIGVWLYKPADKKENATP
jgi:phage-related holin